MYVVWVQQNKHRKPGHWEMVLNSLCTGQVHLVGHQQLEETDTSCNKSQTKSLFALADLPRQRYCKSHVCEDSESRSFVSVKWRKWWGKHGQAPRPSGVLYKFYKNCPKLRPRLWRALKLIWRRGRIAQSWRYADGVYIPKDEKPD